MEINENFPPEMENVYGILQVIMQERPGPATYDSLMGIPKWFLALRPRVFMHLNPSSKGVDCPARRHIESFLVN